MHRHSPWQGANIHATSAAGGTISKQEFRQAMSKLALKRGHCDQHPDQEAVGTCSRCGVDICTECVQRFGYFCSQLCKDESRKSFGNADSGRRRQDGQRMQTLARVLQASVFLIFLAVVGGAAFVVWSKFLHPAGDIVWEAFFKSNTESDAILGINDAGILIRTDNKFVVLDPETGQQSASTPIKSPESDPKAKIEPEIVFGTNDTDDGTIAVTNKYIYGIDKSGSLLFASSLLRGPSAYAFSEGNTFIAGSYSIPQDDEGWIQSHELFCIDAATGVEVWRKEMKPGLSISNVSAADRFVCSMVAHNGQGKGPRLVLIVLDAGSGALLWYKAFETPPKWGPVIYKQCILYEENDHIRCLDRSGRPAWATDTGEEHRIALPSTSYPFVSINKDLMFVKFEGESLCYDADTGRGLWKTSLLVGGANTTVTGNRVFIKGFTVRDDGKTMNLSKMPGFNQAQDVVEEFGLDNVQVQNDVELLLCLEKETGEILWQVEQAIGTIIANDDYVVRVMTSQQKKLSVINRSHPAETYIFQYNLKNGKLLFSKTHKGFDLLGGRILNDMFVGYAFDSISQAGTFFDVDVLRETPVEGRLFAFKLR